MANRDTATKGAVAMPAKGDAAQGTLAEMIASRRTALTLREFAETLNMSYKTVFEWASQGGLPAFQIGSNWRIDPYVAANWIRGRSMPVALGLKQNSSSNGVRGSGPLEGRGHRSTHGNLHAAPKMLVEMIASRRAPLTLRDFAELFNLSYKTTWELASRGRIPVTRVGTTWRLELPTLTKWLGERVGARARPLNNTSDSVARRT